MIIFLANQFVGNTISSGGDVLFTQILRKIKSPATVLVPHNVAAIFSKQFPKIIVIQTDKSRYYKSASSVMGGAITVFQYFSRALNSFIWLSKNVRLGDTLYLTGDFFCNALPAWSIKIFKPKLNVVSNFYHRNPSPSQRIGSNYLVSFFSRLLQSIGLILIKYSSSAVFVLGKEGKGELLKIGFPPSKIIISGAGIDRKLILKYCKNTKIENQLIYVGRINVTKGAFDLISILKLLNSQNPSWHCHFVGQGTEEDKQRLNDMALKQGISEKITIHGYLGEDEKYQLLSSSSILLLPSKEEGFGIVVMEALALQTQVVCYDLPALTQLYQSYPEVHFVKLNDYKMFAETIVNIIGKKNLLKANRHLLPDWEDVYKLQAPYFYEPN